MAKLVQKLSTTLTRAPGFARETLTPKFQTFLHYAAVELRPPLPQELFQVPRGFADLFSTVKSGRWKNLSVKEAWLNTLVGCEVAFWFFVGEVIGKRHIIGYQINVPKSH